MKDLEKIINSAWENKENIDQNSDQDLKHSIKEIINKLDSGKVRVAEKIDGKYNKKFTTNFIINNFCNIS